MPGSRSAAVGVRQEMMNSVCPCPTSQRTMELWTERSMMSYFMTQAGTIRTGSGCTVSVDGLYWINSARWLRATTLPGVMAMPCPGAMPSGGSVRLSVASASRFIIPCTTLAPCVARARTRTSGLRGGEIGGRDRASAWRTSKLRAASLPGDMPRTSVVAACHQSSVRMKLSRSTQKGGVSHRSEAKRRLAGAGERAPRLSPRAAARAGACSTI